MKSIKDYVSSGMTTEQIRFDLSVDRLHSLLRAADAFGYTPARMTFIDGYLACLCNMTGKNIRFSGSQIFYEEKNGNVIILRDKEKK